MQNVYKALGLVLLLLAAQHGAVDHELRHFSRADRAELNVDAGGALDSTCALCPLFSQAATPAFAHSFRPPLLIRSFPEVAPEPGFVAVVAAALRPRSRGPPAHS